MRARETSEDLIPGTVEYHTKEQLGLVQKNLCGPITVESFSGKRYFISFINDFLRKA